MKIATILSSLLLVIWMILTMVVLWTDSLDADMYIKLTMSLGVVAVVTILVAIALREYGNEKKMKEHNYLD
jgi:hypothetical protein